MYVCVMFPYPSGSGLHVGHYYNYSIMDSYCRWQTFYYGTEVFQPFGYDAFGLPAENYARQIGGDPRTVTVENIDNFRNQMDRMNTRYVEKLVTCSDTYVEWTQFIFKLMVERGLAVKKWSDVNWCPSCETVLANEQAQTGNCDRCKTAVEKKNMNQWFFKITDYKDRLIANLETIDYPESTKKQQLHWLDKLQDWCVSRQRKWGCPIPIEGETDTLDTFVDSSFYYLRYLTTSEDQLIPAKQYKQVDLYVGGAEHACMHLIYARFVHMVLFDAGLVSVEEPFKKVIHQGMITKDGAKMSKSVGNVVSPDDYDPDELRLYLMFIGHYFDGGDWQDSHIAGIRKFLKRMKTWVADADETGEDINIEQLKKTIDWNVERFKFNKVVSSFMEFYNKNKNVKLSSTAAKDVSDILAIFAPGFQ